MSGVMAGGSAAATDEAEQPQDRPKQHRMLHGVFRGMLFAVAVLIIAVCAAGFVVPRFINAVPLAVLTGSMEPTYSPGDLVVSQQVDAADVEIGDVVTFQPESGDPTLVTHRVIAKTVGAEGTTITTQGDANGAADEPLVPEQVKGEVIYSVPYLGHVSAALDAGTKSLLAAGAGVVLIGYAIFTVVGAGRRRRREASTS
ncbi:signal peptidase I [Arthrobacter castelli]|uniref:signal peptidase I n=1 Tax=Arthrobacter castelli TaxID=271431 RepID=UPI000415C365|nr:signal peptidase I [Arthrobacter castelli]